MRTWSRAESRGSRAGRAGAHRASDRQSVREFPYPSPRPSPSGSYLFIGGRPSPYGVPALAGRATEDMQAGPCRAFNQLKPGLRARRGMALVDCLAYIALLAMILTMAFGAFYRAMEHSRELARNAAEIARAMHAGERWRADVRASTQPPRLESVGNESQLRLGSAAGEVNYTFRGGVVLRQALPNTNWVELLPRTTGSRMFEERRQQVGVWHWEVELKAGQKGARVPPLFSFLAVASRAPKP